MFNPRSLVYALYTHWDVVEVLVRQSRESMLLGEDQVLQSIGKVSAQRDAEAQATVLRALLNADILQNVPRSQDMQLHPYVLEFVRGLTREHELGLSAVLQARVAAIREASEQLNVGMQQQDMDRARTSANSLAELFRQISLQLDQDRHALLDLAEQAKGADSQMPLAQRYRRVLEAYDQYVEPMNQMMDSGVQGTFYRHLENAERALDAAADQLSVQGGLYSHRQQMRHAGHQAKELRRQGRLVAQQCSDTLLPLREEMRQHNGLSRAISRLLGSVRKRGLRRTFAPSPASSTTGSSPDHHLPLWRSTRSVRLYIGDELRSLMAAVRDYQAPSVPFPAELPTAHAPVLEFVDEARLRQQVARSLPVENLLAWLHQHHANLHDATLLRLFHELQHETDWQCARAEQAEQIDLQHIRVTHYPLALRAPTESARGVGA